MIKAIKPVRCNSKHQSAVLKEISKNVQKSTLRSSSLSTGKTKNSSHKNYDAKIENWSSHTCTSTNNVLTTQIKANSFHNQPAKKLVKSASLLSCDFPSPPSIEKLRNSAAYSQDAAAVPKNDISLVCTNCDLVSMDITKCNVFTLNLKKISGQQQIRHSTQDNINNHHQNTCCTVKQGIKTKQKNIDTVTPDTFQQNLVSQRVSQGVSQPGTEVNGALDHMTSIETISVTNQCDTATILQPVIHDIEEESICSVFHPLVFSTPIQMNIDEKEFGSSNDVGMLKPLQGENNGKLKDNNIVDQTEKTIGCKQKGNSITETSNNYTTEKNSETDSNIKQKRKRVGLQSNEVTKKGKTSSSDSKLRHKKAHTITESLQRWSKSKALVSSNSKKIQNVPKIELPTYALDRLNERRSRSSLSCNNSSFIHVQQLDGIIPLCPLTITEKEPIISERDCSHNSSTTTCISIGSNSYTNCYSISDCIGVPLDPLLTS